MSRIHEALKRAEAEQAAQANRAGLTKPPNGLTSGEKPLSLVGGTERRFDPWTGRACRASPSLRLQSGRRSALKLRGPLTLKTMLFFGPDEQAQGTEQFRALRSRLYQVRERRPLKKVLITSAFPKRESRLSRLTWPKRWFGSRDSARCWWMPICVGPVARDPGNAASPGLSEYLLRRRMSSKLSSGGQWKICSLYRLAARFRILPSCWRGRG